MTPRLAYGLAILFSLFLWYCFSSVQKMQAAKADALTAAQAELAIVSQGDGLEKWSIRAATAKTAREAWEQRRWQGDTAGIASAQVQTALESLISNAGFESTQISVASDPIEAGSEQLLRFEFRGVGDSQNFLNLLYDFAAYNKAIMVTQISAPLREQQKTRMTIGGYVPFIQNGSD